MATNASEDKDIIYFPIDQGEQAKQAKPEYLLARPVYERIAGFLRESLDKTIDSFSSDDACLDLDEHRAHNAILLDGGRGTGKSTILVNLSTYANTVPVERTLSNITDATLADFLLILKPVDPTLLENDDDLFLNIIVAALLRNKEVKNATQDYEKSKTFYARLQALGSALEGTQKQKSEFGMDKLRAFIGNHSVSDEVHKLFYEALKITGKKLIVLPIDDVDTSLQHAFNNLEVVRRYLASPYVVPIISGDLDLFHEVIWRNFFEGITVKASKVDIDHAVSISKNLADEYERKLFSVARRQLVQDVVKHVENQRVVIDCGLDLRLISFPCFVSYLNGIHNYGLNNFEEGLVEFNFVSIRSLSQFLCHLKNELIVLSKYLSERGDYNKSNFWFRFDEVRLRGDVELLEIDRTFGRKIIEIIKNGGYQKNVYLLHETILYWNDYGKEASNENLNDLRFSVFDSFLFQPILHESEGLSSIKDGAVLGAKWREYLKDVVDDQFWLSEIPESAAMSYPLPDKGVPVHPLFNANSVESIFVTKMLVYDQVYLNENEGSFVFFGRLFELLILSLFEKNGFNSIFRVMVDVPFYSLSSFSGTKAVSLPSSLRGKIILEKPKGQKFSGIGADRVFNPIVMSGIHTMCDEINEWRKKYLNYWPSQPSALLVYRVMNKFFTQLANYESEIDEVFQIREIKDLADLGLLAFNAFCAAIGSFEKAFTPSISSESAFKYPTSEFEGSDLYKSNINWSKDVYVVGKSNSSYAKAIFESHPLRKWLLKAKRDVL